MTSYDMDQSLDGEAKQPDSKKITFRFCRECSNMLYPKADADGEALMFSCRTCTFNEPATASCIYRNSLKEDVAETPGNVEGVAQDPTVRDPQSADFVMHDPHDEQDDLRVPELCTLCGQEILCPICEQPTEASIALEVEDPDAEVQVKGEAIVEAEKRERALSSAPRYSQT